MNTDKMHILVVDDDPEICEILTDFLQQKNYKVTSVDRGESMFEVLKTHPVHVIVLDVMLPGADGLELCRVLREHYDTPILMLSAAAATSDRVVGIEMGADDYLPKPFSLQELSARIKSLLRRDLRSIKKTTRTATMARHLKFEGWTLMCDKRKLLDPQNQLIPLSSGEYDMLLVFIRNHHKTLSREKLLNYTERETHFLLDRTIDSQIRRLRKKLEKDPRRPKIIVTVRNVGYRFDCDIEEIEVPIS